MDDSVDALVSFVKIMIEVPVSLELFVELSLVEVVELSLVQFMPSAFVV